MTTRPVILAADLFEGMRWAIDQGISDYELVDTPASLFGLAIVGEVLETDRFPENPYADQIRRLADRQRPPRKADLVTVSREEYERLTADHGDAAELRAGIRNVESCNDRQAAMILERDERIKELEAERGKLADMERRSRAVASRLLERAEKAEADVAKWNARYNLLDCDLRSDNERLQRTIDALIAQQDSDAELIDRLAKERNAYRDEANRVKRLTLKRAFNPHLV